MNYYNKKIEKLHQLAKLYGIQTAYYDVFKQRQWVQPESLLAILKSMNVPIENPHDIKNILHEETQKIWQRLLNSVSVAWNGKLNLSLVIPEKNSRHTVHCHMILEDSNTYTWNYSLNKSSITHENNVDGKTYVVKSLNCPKNLPIGYHHLVVNFLNQTYSCFIISAPHFAYLKTNSDKKKCWGLFTPVYALHSQYSLGAGDFSDLHRTLQWLSDHDGNLLGTLPLFSSFLKKPCEPSPYSPVSKLFFNEFYLDIKTIYEFQNCTAAKNLFNSSEFQHKLDLLQKTSLVDYKKIMSLKRQILNLLAIEFFEHGNIQRQLEFKNFCNNHPSLSDYANFRAVHESLEKPWRLWPQNLREGFIHESDYDPQVKNYHLYAQWQTQLQIKQLADTARKLNIDLYLDMPLGCHPDGYDTWRNKNLFAHDLEIGSPVDATFPNGQNWGFPPLIPHELRESHYQYFIQSLKQVMPYVNILRIDHVMGLHRLYCIPKNFTAKEGAYVRYSAEELYAILSLESHRNQTCIVGENLGTVPQYVNKKLAKHRFYRMYVVQYEMNSKRNINPRKTGVYSISSLNTHDMPTFATYVTTHLELDPWEALQLYLNKLAISYSQFLIINLEDLWLEVMPQNIPVSGKNHPNWRQKHKFSFEQWRQNQVLCATLSNIAMLRKQRI